MSVREDRNKSSTGRGLGLAAAAIGVGVGAALYYLYNRTAETPHSEAANASNDVDRQKAFDDSDSIVFELNWTHYTNDTNSDSSYDGPSTQYSGSESVQTESCTDSSGTRNESDSESSVYSGSGNGYRAGTASSTSDDTNGQSEFWDSLDVSDLEEDFRERTWSLEECTVCCDVMLRNHELEMLPCGHQFHACCIRPWLEERTTCPNCRKTA
ncbi:E3 ubiquitin-protein ligase AIP2 [Eumeta japonica]|uniref:RING-type E3 ubiquitin transferase n=1 Tax=Eumeta variegata TaxID=151549 RepID=A0A4C1ZNI0_EUMVA|nr:E3 ubiquitin-protein ligase AIP2 [Eumeta japonica]